MALVIGEGRLMIADFAQTPPVSGWDREAALRGACGCAAIPLRRGGQVIGALALYAPLPGFFDTGQRALLADIGEDISFALDRFALESQRTLMEAELRASEARFAAVFRVNPIGMSITRFADGLYIDVNDAFLRLFGYAREEVLGITSVQLRVWANAQDRARVLGLVREQGQVLNYETQYRKKDGEIRTGLISAEGIKLGDENYVLALLQDITERKRAEAQLHARGVELHRQLDELRRFQRVAVDRELHMKELKEQNRRLQEQLTGQVKART
jgi:PAS domain S-box-containing protein